jgi:tRNA(Ile)-lysidine synthase
MPNNLSPNNLSPDTLSLVCLDDGIDHQFGQIMTQPDVWLAAKVTGALDDLARRFGSTFILGLSGGGDSMALACLCSHWARGSGGDVRAVCIDHGLRPDSRADAEQASLWARALGLASEVITLDGPWSGTRLQETARDRRHGALAQAARSHGAKVILLAHTAADQAETLAFRLSRRTGLDGLAGMERLAPAPVCGPEWPCLVARPLLDCTRAELRAYLEDRKQPWLEDPANQNLAFSRIRTRHRLARLGQSDRLCEIATKARLLRTAQDEAGRSLLAACGLDLTDKRIAFGYAVWALSDLSLRTRTLRWLIAAMGKQPRAPDGPKTEQLCRRLEHTGFKGATLAGVCVRRRHNQLVLTPAPPRRTAGAHERGERGRKSLSAVQIIAALSGDLPTFVTTLR